MISLGHRPLVGGISLTLGLSVLCVPAAQAAPPLPNGSRVVRIEARDEPLDRFLRQVGGLIDTDVAVAAGVTGLVNGSFDASAETLLRDLGSAFQVNTFYDGAVLHVTPAGDIVSRSFPIGAEGAQRIMALARQLRLTDARNTLKLTYSGKLVANGVPRFVQQIDEMVLQVRNGDGGVTSAAVLPPVSQPPLDYRVFYLRYAWAQDTTVSFAGRQTVIPGVANILRALVDLRPTGVGRSVTLPPTVPGMRSQSRNRDLSLMPTLGAREEVAQQVATALLDSPAAEDLPIAGLSPVSGGRAGNYTRIEADPRLNAIIVRDLPTQMPKYQQLIAALDVEPQALEIEATIIDINTDRMRELGVNWRYNRGLNSLLVGSGDRLVQRFNDVEGDNTGLRGGRDPTLFGGGGIASAVLGNRNFFVARIAALETEGAAKIVSSPQVVTLSNVEATFDNSTTFYVKAEGQYNVDLFNVTAGTNLRVTPHVFKDGDVTRIKLLTQIEDGDVVSGKADLIASLPVVRRSAVNTQALINEGESLLIGGMVRDAQSTGEQKVPLLGDIPIIGNLFKTSSKAGARFERLFLITPRLASMQGANEALERAARPLGATPAPLTPTASVAPVVSPPAAPLVAPAEPEAAAPAAPASLPDLPPAIAPRLEVSPLPGTRPPPELPPALLEAPAAPAAAPGSTPRASVDPV